MIEANAKLQVSQALWLRALDDRQWVRMSVHAHASARVCNVRVCARLVCARVRACLRAICLCARACARACTDRDGRRAQMRRHRDEGAPTSRLLCHCARLSPRPYLCAATHTRTWTNARAAQHNRCTRTSQPHCIRHPCPHLHRDWAHPGPHLHRDWACAPARRPRHT
jgi:hypothetical protein